MTRRQRAWIWLALTCGGITMYQTLGFTTGYLSNYGGVIGGSSGTGCARFATNGAASSVDFCYLLDCQNGFLGGLVNPCAGGTSSLLLDCGNATQVTNGATTQNQNGTTGNTTNTTGNNMTTGNNTTNTGTYNGTGT